MVFFRRPSISLGRQTQANRARFVSSMQTFRFLSCGFFLLSHHYLIGQWCPLTWVDSQLNPGTGPYPIYEDMAVPEYNYFSDTYKNKKVSAVSFFYPTAKEPTLRQTFDTAGFISAEMKFRKSETREFHRFYYANDKRTVIDTITHFIYKYNPDSLNINIWKVLQTDTVFHVQTRSFNESSKLVQERNVFLTPYNPELFKVLNTYPDSIFYTYTKCGNCNSVTRYHRGQKSELIYQYNVDLDNKDHKSVTVMVNNWPQRDHEFIYNNENQLTEIRAGIKVIQIKYDKHKVKRYSIRITPRQSVNFPVTDNGPRHILFTYKYDRRNRLTSIQRLIETDKQAAHETPVKLKWYKNGLIRNNASGQLAEYTYRD
jgi:hypothetical protein